MTSNQNSASEKSTPDGVNGSFQKAVETPSCGASKVNPAPSREEEAKGEKQARATQDGKAAAAFNAVRTLNAGLGETVGLLLRDPKLRHLSLTDLEWLVIPPLATNQILTMRGKLKDKDGTENGLTVPLALALWARVSEDVDRKLEAQKEAGAALRLAPQDWGSGDIPWLVLLSGPEEILPKLEEKVRGSLGAEMKVFG